MYKTLSGYDILWQGKGFYAFDYTNNRFYRVNRLTFREFVRGVWFTSDSVIRVKC